MAASAGDSVWRSSTKSPSELSSSSPMGVSSDTGSFTIFTTFTAFIVSSQQPQTPPFRAGVDLVEVDVTVLDKNGKPVTDLTASDFEIRERGEPQRVETIYLVTADPELLKAPALPAAPAAPAAVPRRPLEPRVFIFIFDMLHLSPAGFDRTRTAIRSFLEDGLRPIDLAGLVVNGTMLGNRIVSDKKALLDLLNGIGPPNPGRSAEMRAWPRILTDQIRSVSSDPRQSVFIRVIRVPWL